MKRLLLWLLTTTAVNAQNVTLPDVVTGTPGSWIIVAPSKVDGGAVKWRLDPKLQEVNLGGLLPPEYVDKLRGKVVTSQEAGQYKVEAWNAKGDIASDIAVTWVIVGKPSPVPPTPTPTPEPPQPDAPIPLAGFRVLIIEEITERDKLPVAQSSILYSKTVRDYLDAKTPLGPDGRTREYRILDKDFVATEPWATAMKRKRQSLPWLIISDGKTGYEGPLPPNVTEMMALLKKYGGE